MRAAFLVSVIVTCRVAMGDIGLLVENIQRDQGAGSFLIFAEPNPTPDQDIPMGTYSVVLKFDDFLGDFETITVDTVNLIDRMDDAGPIFGTTPHPTSVSPGDFVQYVGFGNGLLPAGGGPLMRVDFSVDGLFDDDSSFRVLTVETNPADPIRAVSFVANQRLTFDSKGIGRLQPCDVDANGICDANDIDFLSEQVVSGTDLTFDLNSDGVLNQDDRLFWVVDLMNTYVGDSNLDLVFDTGDLIAVFQAGEYEDDLAGNSSWATGDWTGDKEVDTADLILAFQQNGYEMGRRPMAAVVPEPTGSTSVLAFVLLLFARRKRD